MTFDYPTDGVQPQWLNVQISSTNLADAATVSTVPVTSAPMARMHKLSSASGNLLQVHSDSSPAGTAIFLSQIGSSDNEDWEMRPTGGVGQFELISQANGQCVQATATRTLVQEPCDGTDEQIFYMVTTGPNASQLIVSKLFAPLILDAATSDGVTAQTASTVNAFNAQLSGVSACVGGSTATTTALAATLTVCNPSPFAAGPASYGWGVVAP